mmetsp:Transcript_1760/g.2728  ORF Transcript_1760/g.2728 Transcript_1760/m.2728 type:complete len:541 (+) Transcript_1760:119-1741(+)
MTIPIFRTNLFVGIILALGISLVFKDIEGITTTNGDAAVSSSSSFFLFGQSKEIDVTNEWQVVGENDTIPAGVHVRMDLSTGEKWVKLVDDQHEEDGNQETDKNEKKSAAADGVSMAVIQEDGSVQIKENEFKENKQENTYDFDMMHRTLSKLPDDEKERMGGLPELPQAEEGSARVTKKERQAFEKRMLEIWKKRQEELAQLQEMLLDLPEILKERIKSIDEYLKSPKEHLENMDLDAKIPEGAVTHIVSVLDDLEFQLSDVDMTRDFHTMGGWPLLTLLVSEDSHVPVNETIQMQSRPTEAKIRSIQAQAAWAIGTAVKNTGEFFPYALENVVVDGKTTSTIDLLMDVFCENYEDTAESRTLLNKSIYAIGALLRGNRMAQTHVVQTGGFIQLGEKYKMLSDKGFDSTSTKLIQRLASLSSDIIEDVALHPEFGDEDANKIIIEALTTDQWCDSTCNALTSKALLPVKVQETLLQTMNVMSAHCQWNCALNDAQTAIERMKSEWNENKDEFDDEHYLQMSNLADGALESMRLHQKEAL